MVMFTFSVFDWKYHFCPKNQNCQFKLKFRTTLIWIFRNMQKICGVHFFCCRPEKPFLDKYGQKNQNCQLKQKFGTKRLIWICGIQWWCFNFFSFWPEIPCCVNLIQKIEIVSFWTEILHQTNLNMHNYVENVWCSLFLF